MRTRTIKITKSRRNRLRNFAQGIDAITNIEILLAIDKNPRVCVADLLKHFKDKEIKTSRPTLLRHLDKLVRKSILVRENGEPNTKGWYTINEVNKVNRDFFIFMYGNMSAKVNSYHRNYIKLSKEEEEE